MSESESEAERAYRWRHLDKPADEPTTLEHARAVKLRLRAASKIAQSLRKEWTSKRAACTVGMFTADRWDRESIGDATIYMWEAERELAVAAEEWRACLAARTAMPVAERWNLAALEPWAVAQDKDGAP